MNEKCSIIRLNVFHLFWFFFFGIAYINKEINKSKLDDQSMNELNEQPKSAKTKNN